MNMDLLVLCTRPQLKYCIIHEVPMNMNEMNHDENIYKERLWKQSFYEEELESGNIEQINNTKNTIPGYYASIYKVSKKLTCSKIAKSSINRL